MRNREAASFTRRTFVGGGAALLAVLGWEGCVSFPKGNKTLSEWRPGLLDLHFIYTGCGENMFYRLPDGTSVLNDVGDFYRPRELESGVVLLPSADRLGGDWVCRYLHRVYPEKEIDYAVFSHWHSDHLGHARWDGDGRPDGEPNGAFRYRTTADGRRLNGFLCVAEDYRIRRCFDHQYPHRGAYGTQDSSLALFEDWLRGLGNEGPSVEPFRVGALDQIRLLRDPAAYGGLFSVRNVTANGVAWDGRNGVVDFAAEHIGVTGKGSIDQNTLSATFLIRYGRFSYFASGDLQQFPFRRKDGTTVGYDGYVGERIGPVTVCKMGHHGCTNAMGEAFVRAVRADAYVSCMWSPGQAHPEVLTRLKGQPSCLEGRNPLVLPQLLAPLQRAWFLENRGALPFAEAVHIVVRVAPGGGSYKIFLLDAHDEDMRIVAEFERSC